MKPISKVPIKGVQLRMLKNLAENQNEMADRVNYLTEKVALLLAKPKQRVYKKGDSK